MASSGTLAAGTTSYSSTVTTASTAETVTFPDRYSYVSVTNDGAAPLYVRADGQAAVAAGNNSYMVQPGVTQVFANAQRLWYQSSRVIPQGANRFGGGNTSTDSTHPGSVTPMGSLAGQAANPGTFVSLISGTAGTAYTVAAAG